MIQKYSLNSHTRHLFIWNDWFLTMLIPSSRSFSCSSCGDNWGVEGWKSENRHLSYSTSINISLNEWQYVPPIFVCSWRCLPIWSCLHRVHSPLFYICSINLLSNFNNWLPSIHVSKIIKIWNEGIPLLTIDCTCRMTTLIKVHVIDCCRRDLIIVW